MRRRNGRIGWLVGLAVITGASVPALHAQGGGLREVRPRGAVGGHVVLAFPVGEFENFVDFGGGLGAFALVNLDRDGVVGLRFDGSLLLYGSETVRRPLSQTVQRVFVDVTTNNFIVSLGVGPQFTVGRGVVRPYVFGTVGFAYFATESSVRGTADFDSFASSTNFDDVTLALSSGGGLVIQLSRGRHPVSLDLSASMQRNGRTRYLREGSIRERADGSVYFTPIESEANLMVVKAGVSVGVF